MSIVSVIFLLVFLIYLIYADECFPLLQPGLDCFSVNQEPRSTGTKDGPMNELEMERQKTMEENAAKMAKVLATMAVQAGNPMEDFSSIARAFVFGHAQKGAPSKAKESEQHRADTNDDPNYVPDAAEEASTEDEHEHSHRNSASQVTKSYMIFLS